MTSILFNIRLAEHIALRTGVVEAVYDEQATLGTSPRKHPLVSATRS